MTRQDDLRELCEERAAILEFDAGFSRSAAEALAREEVYGYRQIGLDFYSDKSPRAKRQ